MSANAEQVPEVAQPSRGAFASRLGFILAAAGSAVGLGNIWKFPYITGENGGGLFVLIYLVCIALVGIPIMMAEIMIGRAAQKQPVAAFHALQGKRTGWAAVGWLGVLAGFVILSYYIVVAGWAMDYTLKSIVNFTAPIHDDAVKQAAEYRAVADVDEMRRMLIDRRVKRQTKTEIADIWREVKPSVKEAYERFQAALAAAQDDERARKRLLAVPELRSAVEEVEPLQERINQVREQARSEAEAHYRSLSEEELVEEAATLKRRQIIFTKVENTFNEVAGDGWTSAFWAAIFMLIVIAIVGAGIAGGIERTCQILMPVLFVLILVMVVYGSSKSGFSEAVTFVFKPDVHKLKPSGVLEALGHAFFTLSLGMGAMITYGSYQTTKERLAAESATIAVLDTAVALLACLMIFPITFSYGQEAAAGPGLVFKSMPLAFAEIGRGGMLLATVFFGLVVFAALTSAISLLEVVASYFIDERGWGRTKAAWLLGGVILLFGLPSAFSNDPDFAMSGWKASFGEDFDFFNTMDHLASNWMLPLGGLFIALYAGWAMPARMRDAELEGLSAVLTTGWLLLVRIVAPVLVGLVLIQKVGIVNADEILHGLF